jgi:hypothetical protein
VPNPPPPYPNELTKPYWSKKKGVGSPTGIGEAADAAEEAYGKINWKSFDTDAMAPTGAARQNPHYFEKLGEMVTAEYKTHVQPAITAFQHLSATAKAAVPKLGKSAAATVATDIGTKADHLALALKDNGVFFTKVKTALDEMEATNKKIVAVIAANAAKTGDFLKELLKGLNEVKDDASLTQAVWDVKVKQQGRNVCNSIKTNLKVAHHLNAWTTKFHGFDWSTLGFAQLHGDQLKTGVGHFVTEVFSEAKTLGNDLV